MSFTPANLFGQILFGSIGMGAFVYGKKQTSFNAMLIGVALIAYPYFIPETWMIYALGGLLTSCLFIFRD